jgi:predicted regulator of Ras-like GTPase activity (Roadblock/LC7/MglB family)
VQSQPTIFELLSVIAAEIPGCIATSIVDIESGMSLASIAGNDPLAAEGADAFHCDVYRSLQRAASSLEGNQHAEAVVIMSQHAVFISLPFGGTPYFWHVVTPLDTTIGFTQALMRKYYHQVDHTVRTLMA